MKKIRTGIVGLGRLGMHHALDLFHKLPDANLVAACSIVPSELERVKDWGIELYDNFDMMLNSADLDAVFIVTPSGLHVQQVISAIKAGKHVFCEKPLGVTVEECLEVEKTVDENPHLNFQLGFMRRFDPSYKDVKNAIDTGKVSRPFLIKSTTNDPLAAMESFIKYAPHSGGAWLDMSVHDIDLALWYTGEEVASVYALGGSYVSPELESMNCADNACALVEFKNGAMAQMHVGYSSPHGYQVETELFCNGVNFLISPVPAKDRVVIYSKDGVIKECEDSCYVRFNEAFLLEKEDFFKSILEGRAPQCGAKDGTLATKIAVAATESFEKGEVVYV